jgi:hypothetical protein
MERDTEKWPSVLSLHALRKSARDLSTSPNRRLLIGHAGLPGFADFCFWRVVVIFNWSLGPFPVSLRWMPCLHMLSLWYSCGEVYCTAVTPAYTPMPANIAPTGWKAAVAENARVADGRNAKYSRRLQPSRP